MSMSALLEIYQCQICANMVELVRAGKGQLVCCGQPMLVLTENTVDASREKHVPAITVTADGTSVTVGTVAHPMNEKHHIEWIEAMNGNRTCRTFLKPGDLPQAQFGPGFSAARAYCNLHGLWKATQGG